MKSVIRYQSHLLYRKSYKPDRKIRPLPVARTNESVRPVRAGPILKPYECK